MADLQSRSIPNLIQGVSQQASQQRRDSQCEAQYDCMNSPEAGAVARNGLEVVNFTAGMDLTDCWTHEIQRGTEHYVLLLKGGTLRALNVDTGVWCTVTVDPLSVPYLVNASGYPDRTAWRSQTVDDYTFLAQRNKPPAMLASSASPTRPHEGLLFFREGAYSCQYLVEIVDPLGNALTYSYITPDNSTSNNAPYIDTNQLAATFYRALTGGAAPGVYGGSTGGPTYYLSGPNAGTQSGSTGSTHYGDAATNHGYSVAIDGNLIRIWRNDGVDFELTCSDGAGGAGVEAFKDAVDSVTDLPKNGFLGFVLGVKGSSSTSNSNGAVNSDFYVQYTGGSNTTGTWNECVKPGVLTLLDPATMPQAVVLTALNTFHVQPLVWSSRISGDGLLSAVNPGFVGKGIEEMFWHEQRLGIMTASTVDWSKARNPFTFFPDTLQAVLADAPIEANIAGSEVVAVLQKKLLVDENLYFWAPQVQFRVTQGNNALFSQDTIQIPETTAYEFALDCNFAKIASSVYFATETEDYAFIRNLLFTGGRAPSSDTDVTSHIPAYIPIGLQRLVISDTKSLMFAQTSGAPGTLFLYNFLVEGGQIVQSSWNQWRFPEGIITWCSARQSTLSVLYQRPDGVVFGKLSLSYYATDVPAVTNYRTRLDFRVDDTQCPAKVYDPTTGLTTVTLPYGIGADELADLVVVSRSTVGSKPRGTLFPVTSINATTAQLTVKGDITAIPFYAGHKIVAQRQESEFFLRSQDGVTPTDRLQVRKFLVRYDSTGYTRIEANQGNNLPLKVEETKLLTLGTAQAVLSQPPPLSKGVLEITCDAPSDELTVTLVNDTFLPSRWQTAEWRYQKTLRARADNGK